MEAPAKSREHLDDAVKFFSANAQMIRTIRNNTAGHFSTDAARYAIAHLDPGAVGRVELVIVGDRANMKLHFAGELVATAFVNGVNGKTKSDKISLAVSGIVEAYRHAARVTQIIVAEYLFDQFGG